MINVQPIEKNLVFNLYSSGGFFNSNFGVNHEGKVVFLKKPSTCDQSTALNHMLKDSEMPELTKNLK